MKMYMQLFWKVNINNFDFFIKYILKKYRLVNPDLEIFKKYYYDKKYIYLTVEKCGDNRYLLAWAAYNDFSRSWFSHNDFEYKGEFYDRKEKLKKLNEISRH